MVYYKLRQWIVGLEHKLDEEHIGYCSADNAEQGVSFPDVKHGYYRAGDDFGQKVCNAREVYAFQAVDNEHTHYRIGQDFAEFFDKFWSFAIAREYQKRQKSQKHCDKRNRQNDEPGM